MATIDTQGKNTSTMNAHRATQVHELAGQNREYDLMTSDLVSKSSCEGLNLEEGHKETERLMKVFLANPDDNWVQSDADVDQQIIFNIVFTAPVALTKLIIRASNGPKDVDASGPKLVKLYSFDGSFDFNDTEERAAHVIDLSKEQIESGAKHVLPGLKFSKVEKLAVFIEENQDDSEVTFINRLGLIGRPVKMGHTQYDPKKN